MIAPWQTHCFLCAARRGGDCPHCVKGEYATDTKGKIVYCDACNATGKVPTVSEFSALASAVVEGGNVDITAALVLADFLDERDDSRGMRLRKRVKRYVNRIDVMKDAGGRLLECEFIDKQEYDGSFHREKVTFLSYFFRLTSVGWGDPLPREKRGACYLLTEPGVKHANGETK